MLQKALLATWLLFAASGVLFAQATGTINGRIVDQAGAVIPGANVTVTSTSTGVVRDTVTNGEGLYAVPALSPGPTRSTRSFPGLLRRYETTSSWSPGLSSPRISSWDLPKSRRA